MEISISTENGRVPVAVMHLTGDLDSKTAPSFQSKADELITNGTKYILVDLTHVRFVSSAGLRALHEIFKRLRSFSPDVSEQEMLRQINEGTYKSPAIKLLKPSREAQVSMKTAGFDMFLESHQDLKKAVASF